MFMNPYRAAERNRQEVDGPSRPTLSPGRSVLIRAGTVGIGAGRDVSGSVFGSRWSIGATEPTSGLPRGRPRRCCDGGSLVPGGGHLLRAGRPVFATPAGTGVGICA